MLSGVGPKEELQKFNIPVQADLPVGKNFHDHAGTTLDFTVNPQIRPLEAKIRDPESVKTFIYNRTGALAGDDGYTNMAFVLNNEINPKLDFPNIQIHFTEGQFTDMPATRNIIPEVIKHVFGPYQKSTRWSCFVNSIRPRSRGVVALKSANPYVPPVIDPNYFADPQDLEETVRGMKVCQSVALSPVMRKLGTQPFQTVYPGCEKYVNSDDAYFRCIAQTVLYTLSDPVGTAKMGDPKDPTTVVDPQLRVKNIRGLRVIDNSIMPAIISGNTMAPAIMIGEKGSAMIRATIECHPQEHHQTHQHYDNQHGSLPYTYSNPPNVYGSDSEYDGNSYYGGGVGYGYDSTSYGGQSDYSRENQYNSGSYADLGGHDDYPTKVMNEDFYPKPNQMKYSMPVFDQYMVNPFYTRYARG